METLTKIDGNAIGRPTVSTTLDPWEFTKPKTPTKDHTESGTRLPTHMPQKTALSGLSGRGYT